MRTRPFRLSAGTGMAGGAIAACAIALVVQWITGDTTIWLWAIPAGIGVGLAIGAGAGSNPKKVNQGRDKTSE